MSDRIDDPSHVIARELDHIRSWRDKTGHGENQLMGLALSGGGIRSATFSLGAMQAMAAKGVLAQFDYLSTVSGGGYIGAALDWFVTKDGCGVTADTFPFGSGDPAQDVTIAADNPAASRLRFLRQHGNYLTPGNGITLVSAIAIVLRAMLLNLLVWIPALVLIMSIAIVVSPQHQVFQVMLAAAGALAAAFALGCVVYALFTTAARRKVDRSAASEAKGRRYNSRRKFEKRAHWVLTYMALFAVLGTLPTVAEYLSGKAIQDVSLVSIVAGLASGIWSFFKTGQQGKSIVPLGLVVSAAASLLIYGLLLTSFVWAVALYPQGQVGVFGESLFGLPYPVVLAGLIVITVGGGICVNLNYISLHRFYRDRLMETFLPHPESALAKLTRPAYLADGLRLSEVFDRRVPTGPYHIINTNVVMVNAKDRRRRMRGGDSFILSPLYCGSAATGWRETTAFMDDGMTLPTAMAISGASANPNTGVGGVGLTRNPLVSILMALMNLRLGYWAINPRRHDTWRKRANHFSPGGYEIQRLFDFGGFTEARSFVQLSDGGHFENLGLYELIRRRMRLIVVCDGGADPDAMFGDLRNAIRRVEADFRARITFTGDNAPAVLVPRHESGFPKGARHADRGHIVGDIVYGDGSRGTLILLKTTMIAGLSVPVQAYKGVNPDFPDQTTADQFFDEEQLEAYRELGYRIAERMIEHTGLTTLIGTIEDSNREAA